MSAATPLEPSCIDDDARNAYAREVELLRPRMRAVAQRILGDRSDVDDAVQDAVVQGLRALDRFRGDAALSTWMHRIVVNACLMQLRRRRRRPEVPMHDSADFPEARDDLALPRHRSPEDQLLAGEEIHRLRHAIASQPETTRVLIQLYCVEEKSLAQIADRLGITPSAVKTRLLRARQRIREAMWRLEDEATTEAPA